MIQKLKSSTNKTNLSTQAIISLALSVNKVDTIIIVNKLFQSIKKEPVKKESIFTYNTLSYLATSAKNIHIILTKVLELITSLQNKNKDNWISNEDTLFLGVLLESLSVLYNKLLRNKSILAEQIGFIITRIFTQLLQRRQHSNGLFKSMDDSINWNSNMHILQAFMKL